MPLPQLGPRTEERDTFTRLLELLIEGCLEVGAAMDFSPWDWASTFPLHEAACLIAGVIPLSKNFPHPSELPPQARPVYRELVQAYARWVFWMRSYGERGFPVLPPGSTMLKGRTGPGIAHPRLPNPITTLPGEIIRRSELHRWVKAMGFPSAYQFQPHGNVKAHEQALLPVQAESVQPAPTTGQAGQEDLPKMAKSESTNDRRTRRLRELRNSGGSCTEVSGEWRITSARGFIASMAKREKADGRPMSDPSDLRKDIKRAAMNERSGLPGGKGSSAFNQ